MSSMATNCRVIPLASRAAWDDALASIPHSFYHTWDHCFAMHLTSGHDTYLFCFEESGSRVVCPLSERRFSGYIDVVTPYGFSGFAGSAPQDFTHRWTELMHERGYVCGYIGLNPVFDDLYPSGHPDLYTYSYVHLLDLTRPLQLIFAGLSTNRKRQLRDWAHRPDGIILNRDKLRRFFVANCASFLAGKGARPVYQFSEATLDYWSRLENVLLVGMGETGSPAAVSVFAYTPYVGDYLFNISLPAGRHHAVSLLWYGLTHLKSLGVPLLNLGGGVRARDSLDEFKRRFGGDVRPLSCLRQIYRPEIYAALCRDANIDPSRTNGYFPVYRA